MNALNIRRVDRRRVQAVETLGSKPKFWFSDRDRRLLFRGARPFLSPERA